MKDSNPAVANQIYIINIFASTKNAAARVGGLQPQYCRGLFCNRGCDKIWDTGQIGKAGGKSGEDDFEKDGYRHGSRYKGLAKRNSASRESRQQCQRRKTSPQHDCRTCQKKTARTVAQKRTTAGAKKRALLRVPGSVRLPQGAKRPPPKQLKNDFRRGRPMESYNFMDVPKIQAYRKAQKQALLLIPSGLRHHIRDYFLQKFGAHCCSQVQL
ncbi:MAG: hypothetical protein JRH12_21490 [Deltaproteobacteria bacterium]|jgi:hypothetical protein|nr:hypothetical protein [Deltaproteobacteria bacterium]